MTNKNFERELPEGYKEVLVVDATNKKIVIWMNIACILITLAIIVAAFLVIRPKHFFEEYDFVRNILFIVVLAAYIVLHELVHGVVYKALTGENLKFGITLSVAYCGIPHIYVYRKTALAALVAPLITFTIVFGLASLLFTNQWDIFYVWILMAFHIGGCVGDMYDTYLYLFKLKDPTTLMRDTGPKQTFYQK